MSAGFAIIVLLILIFRMTIGVDLSDEAYYIAFVDEWIKTGIFNGQALGIHQTAAVLVYPAVRLFVALRGDVEGLALFLRFVYLLMSVVAGICFYRFIRELRGPVIAGLAGTLIICFVPFSLPSPSYNTVGMLALVAAFSCSGVYFLADSNTAERAAWGWSAALAWTTAAVAYPTLVVVQVVLVALLVCPPPNRDTSRVWRWVRMLAICQAVAAVGALSIFKIDRLYEMLAFSNASLQVSTGLVSKVHTLVAPLIHRPLLGLLCGSAGLLGLASHWMDRTMKGRVALAVILVVLLVSAVSVGPVLVVHSHDVILMLSIFSALRLLSLCANAHTLHRSLIRTLTISGLVAGLVTSATATNGLVNFAVGGLFFSAFGLALTIPVSDGKSLAAHIFALSAAATILLSAAFTLIYGEIKNPLRDDQARRVPNGVFAGLLTTAEKEVSLAQTAALLKEIAQPAGSIAVFGRLPGIYLLTSMKPMAPSTWDFSQQSGALPAMDAIRSSFYDRAEHRPDVVAVVQDPWTRPPSAASMKVLTRYSRCTLHRFSSWHIQIYTNRQVAPARGDLPCN
jgi:hypothetical protein